MITFCSIQELEAAQKAIEHLKSEHPSLYQSLEEIIYLTRALNFKYQYMGVLLMGDNPIPYSPIAVHESVLSLYQNEVEKLKQNDDFQVLKHFFTQFKNAGYGNICHLLLGMKPESLVGATYVR